MHKCRDQVSIVEVYFQHNVLTMKVVEGRSVAQRYSACLETERPPDLWSITLNKNLITYNYI